MSGDVHSLSAVSLLSVWRAAIVKVVSLDVPDLTARQMAVILVVYTLPGPHRVRDLASYLSISKPAITRALDKLEASGYLRRRSDKEDGRSVLIQRTVKGSVFMTEMGDILKGALAEISPPE
ncbi:MAG: MarR family transcriptional regulator [Alphaproteobacteria bacterium]|nr:MarR family transcriptional regulator [Alphaproteobacteria bacterium]